MVRLLFILCWTIITVSAWGQQGPKSFVGGEKITYHAYYNWHFVWLDAAEVVFTANDIVVNDEPGYYFKAVATSHPKYDFIYRVRDKFKAKTLKQDLTPVWFRRELKHRKKSSVHEYKFANEKNQIYSEIKRFKSEAFKDTLQLQKGMHDILSAAYYARELDFSNRKINEQIPFKLIIDNEHSESYLRYLGKEVVKTRKKRKFRCIKFSAYLIKGDFFKGGESMTIWVTDDANRIPIQVKTDVLIGSVKAIFVDAENLKHPIEAEIIKLK
ncbi:DUF3108 domain-containing protein [Prolixibacteraceae bacterium JC049]|nr:DUF3108 domain-containing protein [Prolixibacteraceae bacterium JC049]